MKTRTKFFHTQNIVRHSLMFAFCALLVCTCIPNAIAAQSIQNKSSQFDELLSESTASSGDESHSSLAAQIRAQRTALNAADEVAATANKMATSRASGRNTCDQGLRTCMQKTCGTDYTKCAGDTDTIWGTKLDACRRDLNCNGNEFNMFTTQIKADRDMNARIASYNAIIDCGNQYNNCIVTECGPKFIKCLGKRTGDAAISKCSKIAKQCTTQDSGLASRMMNVFGTLRVDAEKQVAADEKRLYELRDLMRDTCGRLGAMFDERTLDCVYTVNFYAGEDNTLYASKKAYAGSTFNCDQNWFGVDITTFKDNAIRLTREQKSATSALMGSGIGMATGAITSGAIDRAIDRHKAERAADKAEREHNEQYNDCADDEEWNHRKKKCVKKKNKSNDEDDDEDNSEDDGEGNDEGNGEEETNTQTETDQAASTSTTSDGNTSDAQTNSESNTEGTNQTSEDKKSNESENSSTSS